jgi:hypothetical protein
MQALSGVFSTLFSRTRQQKPAQRAVRSATTMAGERFTVDFWCARAVTVPYSARQHGGETRWRQSTRASVSRLRSSSAATLQLRAQPRNRVARGACSDARGCAGGGGHSKN